MNNKQRWMGGVVLLGGGVLLAALLLKGNDEIEQDHTQAPVTHPFLSFRCYFQSNTFLC